MEETEFQRAMSECVAMFGKDAVGTETCDVAERRLRVVLPDDFWRISSFFDGGWVGGFEHYEISEGGPASSKIVDETERLREAVDLPREFLVLAEPPESLIVLETKDERSADAPVIWCSSVDVGRLRSRDFEIDANIWPSYYAFFRYLLDSEAEERWTQG